MNLRELAEQDLKSVVENIDTGFGWPITLTGPDGNSSSNLVGLSTDIAQVIDPDTGQAVTGRLASVALMISTLYEEGFSLPVGIADSSLKPWVVEFNDINGLPYTFKIQNTNPDRAAGMVTCILESYNGA